MSYGPPNDPNQQQVPPPQYQPQTPPQYQQQVPPPQYQPQAQGGGLQVPSANQLQAGFKRFSLGRQLLLGGGAVAFIAYFLPWYTYEFGDVSGSVSGVGGLPALGFLLVLATLVAFALPLFGKRLSDFVKLPYPEGTIALAASGAALALGFVGGLISKPSDVFGDTGYGIGFFLSALALGAMAAGGWLMHQGRE